MDISKTEELTTKFFMNKELLTILSKFQDKLLDLSKRNKMINSNFQSRSKTHFRIIDEIPDLLYKKLLKGVSMEFKPLPSLDDENPEDENQEEFKKILAIMEQQDEEYIKTIEKIEKDQTDNLNEERKKSLRILKDKVRRELGLPPISTKYTPIEEHCKKQGLNPNYDLPTLTFDSRKKPKWNDKKIQTLMLPDILSRYLDSIYRRHRSTLRERGVNILYFCFGFLEWTESSFSKQKLYSPILIFQVNLFKKKTKLFVEGAGDELSINQTLNEKLKKDFNFELPEFNENEEKFSIDKYLKKVQQKISSSFHKWQVKNQVSFGLYNAKNISIYRDIKDIISNESLTGCLEEILLGKRNNSVMETSSEEYNLDDKKIQKELPTLIESADHSQYSAILDVLKGRNLVIHGPPGTGKSQTIANLIATLIFKGKKVLFVAQKQAALDVVSNKLKASGLGDYVLELFSVKVNKKNIIESIKNQLASRNTKSPRNLEEKVNQFFEKKREINKYADLMSTQFKNTGWNLHDILWNYNPDNKIIQLNIKNIESLYEKSHEKMLESLEKLKDLKENCCKYEINILKEHPFYIIKKLPSNEIQYIEDKIKKSFNKIKCFFEIENNFFKTNKNLKDMDETYFYHPIVNKYISFNPENRKKYIDLLKLVYNSSVEDINNYIKSKDEYICVSGKNQKEEQQIRSMFMVENSYSLNEISEVISILERNEISFIFSDKWQKAKNIFKNIYIRKDNLLSHQEIKAVLNNEQEIFLSQNGLFKSILQFSESEDLKNYLNIKKKYIKILNKDQLERKAIESICQLKNLPSKPEIIKAAYILKEENICSIFSKKYRSANKIFKKIYVGKKGLYSKYNVLKNLYEYLIKSSKNEETKNKLNEQKNNLYENLKKSVAEQNITTSQILKQFYYYLKNRQKNKDKELYIEDKNNMLYQKLINQTGIENIDNLLNKLKGYEIYHISKALKNIDSEFIKTLLDHPNYIIEYKKLIEDKKVLTSEGLELCKKMEIDLKLLDNECELKNMGHFFKQITNSQISLKDYRTILDIVDTFKDNDNLKSFYEGFIESKQDIKNIEDVYKYSVYKALKDLVEKEYHNEFSYYSPYRLNKTRKDLKSLDKEIMFEFQKEVIKEVSRKRKNAPTGTFYGRVRDKTEMSLIYHIIGLSSSRISIRDLLSRAWQSISILKPCFLLSPLTVSQTLPLDQNYDVLIIDEASQMKPEYAIASVARAKQVVIVGDQKQLPPTDFFQVSKEIDEDDEDDLVESILDKALTVLPHQRSLLWHYRSRHEDLIKFSNQKFYDNKLIFPSTVDTNNKNKGIKHVYLQEGLYRSRSSSSSSTGGFNDIEAKKVVSEIIKFMKERPKESLGVATMNRAQTDLIENQFDIDREKDHDVDKYLNFWEKQDEGINEFFIKNLENVQGDERDVIFISTVYGPDSESKKVFQRFGPIAGKHGHRRLNVLFTRAKNQIVLFTSLKSSDIKIENKSEGVKTFRSYFHFIETKKLPSSGLVNSREIESPFQKWAMDQINSFPGFSAWPEIGVKGYRIDIGVKHEKYPHGYIMAVETDGASYHSIKSARDRDKLRQEILEFYGWKFHRIWSTDWLRNPTQVKKDLKKALEDRLKELKIQE